MSRNKKHCIVYKGLLSSFSLWEDKGGVGVSGIKGLNVWENGELGDDEKSLEKVAVNREGRNEYWHRGGGTGYSSKEICVWLEIYGWIGWSVNQQLKWPWQISGD